MKTIPYGHQWIDESDIKEVVGVLGSDWITQGPKIKEFEGALCEYTGAKYAVAVSSGTAALHIACLAAEIKEGDEVITSPITFVATANCVLYCGGKPVFADIQEDTINIDPEEIKKKITRRTKAIIPVHFAGHPCDMEEIHKIAERYDLIVIEDASHALGAKYEIGSEIRVEKQSKSKLRWIKVGSCKHSDMTVFSFHPVKSITTGEGGAVLTNRKDLHEKLLMFRNHGITRDQKRFLMPNRLNLKPGSWYYEMQILGFNYRITDIQCALGVSQLRKLDKFIKRRREIVQIYNKELSKIEEIELPVERKNVKSSWHLYPIRIKDKRLRIKKSGLKIKRNKIFDTLRGNGIGVQVHYIPVYLQPYYIDVFGYRIGDYLIADSYYNSAISLPIYPHLAKKDIKRIITIVFDSFKRN